jgi:lipoic acid synthetase
VPSGRPEAVDAAEPESVSRAVAEMGLKHAVITTVVRDDLADGGAAHIAACIRAIRDRNPATTIEVLVSEYHGDPEIIRTIVEAGPEVFGHNIETVRRLYPRVRDRRFTYDHALEALRSARALSRRTIVKSAMMVGHGETSDEVRETLVDLRDAGCETVCIGQYLRPTRKQCEVAEFIPPERFEVYERLAYEIGFEFAVAGPFVRSSYRSEAVLETEFARRKLSLPRSNWTR